VPTALLPSWCRAVGWERLVNRQGTTWRKLDPARQAAVVDEASAQVLMAAEASVIKRPVVAWADGSVSVGFAPADWQARLA
jgi:arsenate reductase-like glutaredoxin family protein